ncbi:uncharacterized protein BROUX77_007501 [Berkeleyomyces rouxiae]|uniref:uncharacterized protein n=1 Tax=Berkeleyomyces rouxiae TaxID=2035830 RepID=UPI003B7D54ED
METLGICYLGCLLLRAPTKIGDIFEWARKNELPYVRAHELIPKSLTERLPQPYPRMLKLPIRVPIQGNQLHATILRLELSYDLNYSLKYPPLNYHLLALDYTQNLGLPVEAVTLVKQFTAFLQITYSLPTTKSRIRLIDQPEVQLISLIVAITKHFFPFTGTSGIQSRPGYLPTIDWAVWAKHMKSHQDETSGVEDYTAISGEDIVSMTQEEEERFLEHVLVFSKADDEENRLINFFPFTRAEKYKPIEKVKTNSSKLSEATVIQAKGVTYTGDTEPVAVPYFSVSDRTVDDLSEEARLFYKLAAAQSGLDVQTLIRAVDMVETQIQSAERQRK